MKRVFLFFVAAVALLSIASTAEAQPGRYRGTIHYSNPVVERHGNVMTVQTVVNLTDLHLNRQQMVILTPMIISPDGRNRHDLAPIAITGRVRNKMIDRGEKFNTEIFGTKPMKFIRHVNNPKRDADLVELFYEVRYEEWMRAANFIVNESVSGCANCKIEENQHLLSDRMLPPLFIPNYNLVYVTPPAEEVKRRSENYSAMLNFVVGKYDIRRDFKDNAAQLDEINRIFKTVRNDKNLTITEVSITGFASPDGNFNSNMTLSKNRAQSLANYIAKEHSLPADVMKVSWKGEDWEGLRKAVAESNINGKESVLNIIDNYADANTRKAKIKALSGGQIWRYMLDNIFPQLRRNEYTISYIARAFDVNEAKEVFRANPRHLSLNEMFHVANTYPKGSDEFNNVFDVAVRLYPESEIARINAAAAEIENGAVDMAIRRLSSIQTAEAWNNLGVAYTIKGEYAKAEEMFRKAAANGNAIAVDNLRQMELWKQNK